METSPEKVLHPLQDPKILGKIFEGSTLQDLKSYRQVCRAWLEGSSKAMNESAEVFISSRRKDQNGLKGLEAFMALMENDVSTFAGYEFPSKVILLSVRCDLPRFWTLFGSQVKSLILFGVTFPSAVDFRQVIFLACPNLEDLKIHLLEFTNESGDLPEDYVPPQYPENRKLKSLDCDVGPKEFGLSWIEVFNRFPFNQNAKLK